MHTFMYWHMLCTHAYAYICSLLLPMAVTYLIIYTSVFKVADDQMVEIHLI